MPPRALCGWKKSAFNNSYNRACHRDRKKEACVCVRVCVCERERERERQRERKRENQFVIMCNTLLLY